MKIDIKDLYKVIRSQIEHINNTINHRVNWLFISQSLCFSGYAILLSVAAPDTNMVERQHLLLVLFAFAAIIINVISLIDIKMSMSDRKKLMVNFTNKFISKKEEDKEELDYPAIEGFNEFNQYKNLLTLIIPVMFIIIWVIIINK